MIWEETETEQEQPTQSETMVDVSFRIHCPQLPVDHVQPLRDAVAALLPWLETTPGAGIHSIHGAASGNGWIRPDDILHLSRRARLDIRAPAARQSDVAALSGARLDIAGYPLELGQASVKALPVSATLFARHVRIGAGEEAEAAFVDAVVGEIKALGVRLKKLVCGRGDRFTTSAGPMETRSVMVADLQPRDAICLQEHGLRDDRMLGCGLFIPHKGIAAVKPDANQ